MKFGLPSFLRRRRNSFGSTGSALQPGLWSQGRADLSEVTPRAQPASQPVARGQNPFAASSASSQAEAASDPGAGMAPVSSSSPSEIATPTQQETAGSASFLPVRPTVRRRPSLWHRSLVWLGLRPHSGARRRVFDNVEQLELVLGRPRNPGSPARSFSDGPLVQTRRSGPVTGKSKVIYESPPAAAVDAHRMTEESDRTYARLRGRRLDSLRVTAD